MAIVIAFHRSGYRDLNELYINHAIKCWSQSFPVLISHTRILKILQSILIPLSSYLTQRKSKPTGIAFIDSSKIAVCHNLRIPRHQVFDGIA